MSTPPSSQRTALRNVTDRVPVRFECPGDDVRAVAGRVAAEGVVAAVAALLAVSNPLLAVVVAAAATVAASIAVSRSTERVWVGDDWIATRGLLPALVVDAADVATVTAPADGDGEGRWLHGPLAAAVTLTGADAAVTVRTFDDRALRLPLDRLTDEPELAWAVAAFLMQAERHGAAVSAGTWATVARW